MRTRTSGTSLLVAALLAVAACVGPVAAHRPPPPGAVEPVDVTGQWDLRDCQEGYETSYVDLVSTFRGTCQTSGWSDARLDGTVTWVSDGYYYDWTPQAHVCSKSDPCTETAAESRERTRISREHPDDVEFMREVYTIENEDGSWRSSPLVFSEDEPPKAPMMLILFGDGAYGGMIASVRTENGIHWQGFIVTADFPPSEDATSVE